MTTSIINEKKEQTILRKTLPFFIAREEQILFKEIDSFVQKYKNLPSKESILIELSNRKDINEDENRLVKELISQLNPEDVEQQWLLDTTEKFCKDRAVHNAVLDGIKILDKKDKKRTQSDTRHISRRISS